MDLPIVVPRAVRLHYPWRPMPIPIKLLFAARQLSDNKVYNHVARSRIKSQDVGHLRPSPEEGDVCDSTDILNGSRFSVASEKSPIREWYERRALPSRGHIRASKVGHDPAPGLRRNHGGICDLKRSSARDSRRSRGSG